MPLEGLLGRKLGMTQVFDKQGQIHGVTVIEAGPIVVSQLKTAAKDGYGAVQVAYGSRKRVNKPARGHLKKLGDFRLLREFRLLGEGEYSVGDKVGVELFDEGDLVDVTGVSRGRGFAGGVKRWNFSGGPKTHGQSDRHRAPGSIGSGTTPGRVYNGTGKEVDSIDVDDLVFGIESNGPVVHQALVASLANRRAGTAMTKTRGEVRGSTRKIRKQKGTGASRQGSIRAPQHRHGGIVHGPRSRSYAKDLPKRMRRLAIRSVLSSKAADGSLRVVQELSIASPSTKEVARIVSALGFERSVLVVTGEPDLNVKASARNLEKVSLLPE